MILFASRFKITGVFLTLGDATVDLEHNPDTELVKRRERSNNGNSNVKSTMQ